MNKPNLLKEAILDAKLIKQTAIKNAKKSITESLDSHVKEMVSAKIEEMESEEEELDLDEIINELDNEEVNEYGLEHDPKQVKDEDYDHPSLKKKQAVKEEETETETETETEEEEELDLENMTTEEFTETIKDVVQDLVNSGEVDLVPSEDSVEGEGEEGLETEEDPEVNIDELLSEIDNEIKESKKKKEDDKKDEAIKELWAQLNESKLFSSKLLYANKLFVKGNLSEKSKVSILESLDKASNVKEAKLIFEALSKSIVSPKKSRISEIRGSASKSITTTKTSPVINIDPTIKRMQKLAGLED